ncbi:MAG: hypothetical protein AAF468_22635 [Pseudomonadota bacterium]
MGRLWVLMKRLWDAPDAKRRRGSHQHRRANAREGEADQHTAFMGGVLAAAAANPQDDASDNDHATFEEDV